MPRKPKPDVVSTRKTHRSFIRNIKHAQARSKKAYQSKNHPVNRAGNLDWKSSADELNNLFQSIIKEFSVIRKPDDLISGTNEVLRHLEKGNLIAVFMSMYKASNVIKKSVYDLCHQAGASFIFLKNEDYYRLGPEFPKSITYGIKKESLSSLENLRSLLLELSMKRNKKEKDEVNVKEDNKVDSFIDISFDEMKLPSAEETAGQEVLDASTFYHTHKGPVSKKFSTNGIGFLSLGKFSTDERETDFLDYDSVACSGVLSLK